MIDEHELINRFTYRPALDGQTERYDQLRDGARLLARLILEMTPESREQELAITRLEEAVFWANAAISRNE